MNDLFCSFVFFFFSSRRRHTRSLCDWSSDVCSSDLKQATEYAPDAGILPEVGAVVFDEAHELEGVAGSYFRSEERRVGKSVDLGGRRIIKKKKKKTRWEMRLYRKS